MKADLQKVKSVIVALYAQLWLNEFSLFISEMHFG